MRVLYYKVFAGTELNNPQQQKSPRIQGSGTRKGLTPRLCVILICLYLSVGVPGLLLLCPIVVFIISSLCDKSFTYLYFCKYARHVRKMQNNIGSLRCLGLCKPLK